MPSLRVHALDSLLSLFRHVELSLYCASTKGVDFPPFVYPQKLSIIYNNMLEAEETQWEAVIADTLLDLDEAPSLFGQFLGFAFFSKTSTVLKTAVKRFLPNSQSR